MHKAKRWISKEEGEGRKVGEEEGVSREGNELCSAAGGSEPVSHRVALDIDKKRRGEQRKTGTSVAQIHHSLGHGWFPIGLLTYHSSSLSHPNRSPRWHCLCSAFSG